MHPFDKRNELLASLLELRSVGLSVASSLDNYFLKKKKSDG